ncbi:MAG: YjbQ family protein [Acidobacteria bacterium]|nr:YjbQ family protein [Acidobacteriota bacterium]
MVLTAGAGQPAIGNADSVEIEQREAAEGMSKPQLQPIETVSVAESEAEPANYKVFHRIVDWITNDRMQLLNITDRVNEIVRKSGVRDGMVHLQSLHTTTAVFLNEWQDALLHDVRNFFDQVVHREQYYRHNDPEFSDCERRNADSHMRGMLMDQTLSLQVRNATVLLGTWQSIILAEFDGPRSRSLAVQVSGV